MIRKIASPTPNGSWGASGCQISIKFRAYFHSTATLNYIRTLLSSGFADLHRPLEWSFSHVRSPELQTAFTAVIESLQDSLDFMKIATGSAGGTARGGTETVDFYTRYALLVRRPLKTVTRLSCSSMRKPSLDHTSLQPLLHAHHRPLELTHPPVEAESTGMSLHRPNTTMSPPISSGLETGPDN